MFQQRRRDDSAPDSGIATRSVPEHACSNMAGMATMFHSFARYNINIIRVGAFWWSRHHSSMLACLPFIFSS
jgi:hypothetical protein